MIKIVNYSRTKQIIINEDIDYYSELFFDTVKKRLKESYVFHTNQDSRNLEFSGSIFRFVWNAWDLFNPISKGKIRFLTIDEIPFVRYEINFREALVIALIFHIIPIFSLKFEPTISFIMFGAIWFLYFLNYLISSIRFSSYIADTLLEVNKISGYKTDEDATIP